MQELNTVSHVPNDKDIIVKYGYEHFKDYYRDCELNHKKWWNENVKDDWTIIDAGANVGIFSILFARKAKHVYAFEPCKETVEIMKKNIKENNLDNKITIIPLALSDHSSVKKDIIHHIWSKGYLNEEFQFITIDKFVKDNNIKVNAIKIDVDSYDYEVLKGCKQTLLEQNPIIVVEVVDSALNLRGYRREDIFNFMSSINYTNVLNLDNDNYLFMFNYNKQKLKELAFNADIYAEKEVDHLLKYTKTKIGIETGTSFGSTTTYLSDVLEKVYSIEVNEESYIKAKETLKDVKNIKLYLGSSERVLEKIFNEKKELTNENIFFYLDAHWEDYWPLLDELDVISKYCKDKAIICIDDFQIPNRMFGFDSYKNQPLNFEYIKDKLDKIYPKGYTYWYSNIGKRRKGYENKGLNGKFYVVPKYINIDWLINENGINYSNLIREKLDMNIEKCNFINDNLKNLYENTDRKDLNNVLINNWNKDIKNDIIVKYYKNNMLILISTFKNGYDIGIGIDNFSFSQLNDIQTNSVNWMTTDPVLIMTYLWSDSWQHFMQDVYPILYTVKQLLDKLTKNIKLLMYKPKFDTFEFIINMLGFTKDQFLFINIEQSYVLNNNALVYIKQNKTIYVSKDMFTITLGEYNKMWKLPSVYIEQSAEYFRNYISKISNNISEKYVLYLSRKGLNRSVNNEEELLNKLKTISNIKVFDLQNNKIEVKERFILFYNAEIVIAPHGGMLFHIYACKKNLPLIEFMSKENCVNVNNLATSIPLEYYPIVCEDLKEHNQKSYNVNINDVYNTLLCIMNKNKTIEIKKYISYAETGQDLFIYNLLIQRNNIKNGTYLEIGANHPIKYNTTYLLELNDWKGISVEIDFKYQCDWKNNRKNTLIIGDATKLDYTSLFCDNYNNIIDFLSLDVDGHYCEVLEQLPLNKYIFRVIIIEHDFYQYGNIYRDKERIILNSFGYKLICSDVRNADNIYEDWWIHPSYVNNYEDLICDKLNWQDIIRKFYTLEKEKYLTYNDYNIKLLNVNDVYSKINQMLNLLKTKDIKNIKIDVGLSYNAPYSQLWLENLSNRFVIGFEPNPTSINSLINGKHSNDEKYNWKRLDTKYINDRFYLFPYALDFVNNNEITNKDFYMTNDDTISTSSLYKPKDEKVIQDKISIQCINLSMLLDRFPWDRFPFIEHMKIDAQGCDFRIIKSINMYLDKFVFITIECGSEKEYYNYNNEDSNYTFQDIYSYMLSKNFVLISNCPLYENTNGKGNVVAFTDLSNCNFTFLNKKYVDIARTLDCSLIKEY